jgi:hypothetical protein
MDLFFPNVWWWVIILHLQAHTYIGVLSANVFVMVEVGYISFFPD